MRTCVMEVLKDGSLIPYFDNFDEEEAADFVHFNDPMDERNFFLATLILEPLKESSTT